jgi:hypothetical protein
MRGPFGGPIAAANARANSSWEVQISQERTNESSLPTRYKPPSIQALQDSDSRPTAVSSHHSCRE